MNSDRKVYRRLWIAAGQGAAPRRYYPARLLELKAELLQTIGQWDASERVLRAEIAWLRTVPAPLQLADACNQLGSLLMDKGNNREALALCLQASALFRRSHNDLGYAQSLSNIAGIYHNQGHYAKARSCLNRALALASKARDPRRISQYTGNLGIIHYQMGNYRRAIDCYDRTLSVARERGFYDLEMAAVGNLALAYHAMDDYDRGLEYNKQYLFLARTQGNPQVISYAIGNLGMVYYDLNRYREAMQSFVEHRRITLELGDKPGRILAADNLGSAHHALGDGDRAAQCYQESLDLSLELGNHEDAARALTHLGSLSRDWGDLAAAQRHYSRAERYLAKCDSPYYRCYILYHRAVYLMLKGDRARSCSANAQARRIALRLDHPEIMMRTAIMAAKLSAARHPAGAVTRLRALLRQARQERYIVVIMLEIAALTKNVKDIDRARRLLGTLYQQSEGIEYQRLLEEADRLMAAK